MAFPLGLLEACWPGLPVGPDVELSKILLVLKVDCILGP